MRFIIAIICLGLCPFLSYSQKNTSGFSISDEKLKFSGTNNIYTVLLRSIEDNDLIAGSLDSIIRKSKKFNDIYLQIGAPFPPKNLKLFLLKKSNKPFAYRTKEQLKWEYKNPDSTIRIKVRNKYPVRILFLSDNISPSCITIHRAN